MGIESFIPSQEGAGEGQEPNFIEALTPARISELVRQGELVEVIVRRSSGEIEDGWVIVSNDPSSPEFVQIMKHNPDGSILTKNVSLQQLKEWSRLELGD